MKQRKGQQTARLETAWQDRSRRKAFWKRGGPAVFRIVLLIPLLLGELVSWPVLAADSIWLELVFTCQKEAVPQLEVEVFPIDPPQQQDIFQAEGLDGQLRQQHKEPLLRLQTDSQGILRLGSQEGIDPDTWYLLRILPLEREDGVFQGRPFLVSPSGSQTQVIHHNKMEYVPGRDSKWDLTVCKVWKSDGQPHPQAVKMELYAGNDLVQTAWLSQENNWRHTFTDLLRHQTYGLAEAEMEDYQSELYIREDLWVVTNTPLEAFRPVSTTPLLQKPQSALPATGQNWLGVLLLAASGMGCLCTGICRQKRESCSSR